MLAGSVVVPFRDLVGLRQGVSQGFGQFDSHFR